MQRAIENTKEQGGAIRGRQLEKEEGKEEEQKQEEEEDTHERVKISREEE
jgi:hypothetical protein